jgi:hypothetical protein
MGLYRVSFHVPRLHQRYFLTVHRHDDWGFGFNTSAMKQPTVRQVENEHYQSIDVFEVLDETLAHSATQPSGSLNDMVCCFEKPL